MRTKIIATIGPASLEFGVFKKMVDEGVNYIRVNTAYGDTVQYGQILENLRKCQDKDVKAIFDIKSLEIIDYINRNKIEMIADSFTESVEHLRNLRQLSPEAMIISKIESVKGVENFEDILEESDGIMVARGDLGEAVRLERVPCLQKRFTRLGLVKSKFVIAATEMLMSMTNQPTPTRAEVSDVANAVFDEVDAVMLSEETAIGKYPVEAVSYMRRVIEEAEKCEIPKK